METGERRSEIARWVLFCGVIVIVALLISTILVVYSVLKEPKKQFESNNLKPEEVLWFARKFPCSEMECTNNKNVWNDKVEELIKEEWKDKEKLKKKRKDKNLWIPLNGKDSLKIEIAWRKWMEYQKNCKSNNEKCIENSTKILKNPILVMENMFEVILYGNNGYLNPIFWQNETEIWYLMRGEWIYEVKFPPSVMYFTNIEINASLESYYQPVPPKYASKADSYGLNLNINIPWMLNYTAKTAENKHIIFVIHGIGHHEGEEKIVKNANEIRNGFIKFIKKFHPTFPIPIVIPVPWRHTLEMDKEKVWSSHLLRPEEAKVIGIILNDVLYYLSSGKEEITKNLIKELNSKFHTFTKHNLNFTGKISFLAHSLGSVISFDLLNNQKYDEKLDFEVENLFLIGSPLGRFLINEKFTFDQLNQNHWIKNGKLFNILHFDDPVAHRIETLYSDNYKYVTPSEIYLNLHFREGYSQILKISEEEAIELTSFYNYFINDRNLTRLHDSFLTIDYLELNFWSSPCASCENILNTVNHTEIFKDGFEFLEKRFSGKKITKQPEIIHENNKKIPHRFDYNLHKAEYDEEDGIKIERDFEDWINAIGFAHMSYWDRPEVIALMTNVIYDFGPDNQYNDTITTTYSTKRKHYWKWLAYNCFDCIWRIIFGVFFVYCYYKTARKIKKRIQEMPDNYEIFQNDDDENEMNELTRDPSDTIIEFSDETDVSSTDRAENILPPSPTSTSTPPTESISVLLDYGKVVAKWILKILGICMSPIRVWIPKFPVMEWISELLTIISNLPGMAWVSAKYIKYKSELHKEVLRYVKSRYTFDIIFGFFLLSIASAVLKTHGNFKKWYISLSGDIINIVLYVFCLVFAVSYLFLILHAVFIRHWKLLKNWIYLHIYAILIFLLLALRSPDTIALVGWNIQKLIAPWFAIPNGWIYLIYFIFFIPGTIHILFAERKFTRDTIYRYMFTTVISLLVISILIWTIEFYAKKFRDYQLGCIHYVEKGICREYILYNNVTKDLAPIRNPIPLFSASPILSMFGGSSDISEV